MAAIVKPGKREQGWHGRVARAQPVDHRVIVGKPDTFPATGAADVDVGAGAATGPIHRCRGRIRVPEPDAFPALVQGVQALIHGAKVDPMLVRIVGWHAIDRTGRVELPEPAVTRIVRGKRDQIASRARAQYEGRIGGNPEWRNRARRRVGQQACASHAVLPLADGVR